MTEHVTRGKLSRFRLQALVIHPSNKEFFPVFYFFLGTYVILGASHGMVWYNFENFGMVISIFNFKNTISSYQISSIWFDIYMFGFGSIWCKLVTTVIRLRLKSSE